MSTSIAFGVSRAGIPVRERVAEIDFLRGFAIFLMIFDHLAYDFTQWGSVMTMLGDMTLEANRSVLSSIQIWIDLGEYVLNSDWRTYLHCIFVGVFFLLSGISATFSKKHWERTGWLFAIGYGLSTILAAYSSYSGDVSYNIFCGLLNTMAIAHLVYAVKTQFLKDKWSDLYFFGIFLVLTIAFTSANPSYPGRTLGDWYSNYWKIISGQMAGGLDYIRPLPCTAILFLGSFIGKTLYKNKKSYIPQLKYAQPFVFFGQHSFAVYVIHQFVLVAILAICTLSLGFVIEI